MGQPLLGTQSNPTSHPQLARLGQIPPHPLSPSARGQPEDKPTLRTNPRSGQTHAQDGAGLGMQLRQLPRCSKGLEGKQSPEERGGHLLNRGDREIIHQTSTHLTLSKQRPQQQRAPISS